MLWKCCTQYASKSGKFSRGHKTGKGEFSFQSQRKAMPKNVQTTTQLHSCHPLAKLSSNFLIRNQLPSSAPPPHWAGEFSCPYRVKLGLEWLNGNAQNLVNHLRFEHNVTFSSYFAFSAHKEACPRGSLTYWAHRAGCGAHATVVLFLGGRSCAFATWFWGWENLLSWLIL